MPSSQPRNVQSHLLFQLGFEVAQSPSPQQQSFETTEGGTNHDTIN